MVIPLVDGMIVSRRALGKVFMYGQRVKVSLVYLFVCLNTFMNQEEVEIRKW